MVVKRLSFLRHLDFPAPTHTVTQLHDLHRAELAGLDAAENLQDASPVRLRPGKGPAETKYYHLFSSQWPPMPVLRWSPSIMDAKILATPPPHYTILLHTDVPEKSTICQPVRTSPTQKKIPRTNR